ncbi:hypothetical protein ACJX0J_014847, partial [Zea mays]
MIVSNFFLSCLIVIYIWSGHMAFMLRTSFSIIFLHTLLLFILYDVLMGFVFLLFVMQFLRVFVFCHRHMYIEVAGWEIKEVLIFGKMVRHWICFVCICAANLDNNNDICALATRSYVIFLAIIPSSLERFKNVFKKQQVLVFVFAENSTSFGANWNIITHAVDWIQGKIWEGAAPVAAEISLFEANLSEAFGWKEYLMCNLYASDIISILLFEGLLLCMGQQDFLSQIDNHNIGSIDLEDDEGDYVENEVHEISHVTYLK